MRPSSNSSRRCRASVRSVLARRSAPRKPASSAGSARWGPPRRAELLDHKPPTGAALHRKIAPPAGELGRAQPRKRSAGMIRPRELPGPCPTIESALFAGADRTRLHRHGTSSSSGSTSCRTAVCCDCAGEVPRQPHMPSLTGSLALRLVVGFAPGACCPLHRRWWAVLRRVQRGAPVPAGGVDADGGEDPLLEWFCAGW